MLYVFCGDRFAARERSRAFVAACQKKRSAAEYIYLSSSGLSQSLEELLVGQGLFEKKYIVFCDELLGDSSGGHLLGHPSRYHESPHMFIVFEPSLSPSLEKQLSGVGAVVQRFAEKKDEGDSRALFGFTDVFCRGVPEKTLASFFSLVRRGESPSSLLTILLWQIRMLALVSSSSSASEAGVKPFVFSKTKKALAVFSAPFSLFVFAEEAVRSGRLRGSADEEIAEYIILCSGSFR